MKDSHVLILGAGLMQKPAIEAAKSLNYKVTLIDGNPKALCVPMADTFIPIDLKDKEAIRTLALELKKDGLAGIFTAGTDFSASVAYACEACHVPGHSYEAALRASNKVLMRQCFAEHKVPCPHFTEIKKCELEKGEYIKKVENLPLPLVVKPVDNMGGRGCRLVKHQEDLEKAIADAILHSRTGNAIVEEFMDGPEFSIDALVYKGTVTICGFADRHIYFPPYFIEMGHTMPTNTSEQDRSRLIETFVKGIQALGLTAGAAKADIKLTSKGPMIGEIAARLSGGYMSGWTFPYASDFFLTQQALCIATGEEPKELLQRRQFVLETDNVKVYDIPCTKHCCERAWISIPGTVAKVWNGTAPEKSAVKNIFPRVKAGDPVIFPRNNVEKCGNVITLASNRGEGEKAAENTIKKIVLQLEKNNKETETFLENFSFEAFPPNAFTFSKDVNESLEKFFLHCNGVFSLGDELKNTIPSCLKPYVTLSCDSQYDSRQISFRDWNYRTLEDTICFFDSYLKELVSGKKTRKDDSVTEDCVNKTAFKPISLVKLWKSCIRGGIQGLLYTVDSEWNLVCEEGSR